MRRVALVGNSGSGKSTLGRALASRLLVPYVELDSIHHQPGWTELPREQFRARVSALVEGPGWVIDGNYSSVRDLVWAAADTVIAFGLPRARVMRQLVPRTLGRMVTRRELWNGNRESLGAVLSRDRERNILLWAWTQHARYRSQYREAAADPANAHLDFRWIRCRADAEALLASP